MAQRIVHDVGVEHHRLQRLVERMLQLARLDAVPTDEAAAHVARVVDEAIALVRPLDPKRRIDLTPHADAYAAIAPDDLRDAVRNVLENAIRYAPGAAIRVDIDVEPEAVIVRIADDGPGMDAFTAQHAFDRFFRGMQRGDVEGSGLGLAIVRRIAERVNGRAVLVSSPGHGTSVELELPHASSEMQTGGQTGTRPRISSS